MRVAIIAVLMASASSPAPASPSCMTQSEARQKFPASHLWWHGPNRCWDATPSRQRLAQRIESRRQGSRGPQTGAEEFEEKKPVANASRWREAMSKASPDDIAGATARAQAQAEVTFAPSPPPAPPLADWRERWVDIVQRVPPIAAKAGPAELAADLGATDPIVTPTRVMLALLVLLLAFGAFELLRRPARRAD
ncbi:MAG: hypothetical protein ACRC1G_15655 [Bradyrhizobium sp.]